MVQVRSTAVHIPNDLKFYKLQFDVHIVDQTSQICQLPVLESVPEVKFENRQRSKILFFDADSESENRLWIFQREVGKQAEQP